MITLFTCLMTRVWNYVINSQFTRYSYDRCLSDISPRQVTLNSMHRYLPKIVISKHLSKKNLVVVHSQDFHECCFIAVTAYQNDKVSRLKYVYVFNACDTVLNVERLKISLQILLQVFH